MTFLWSLSKQARPAFLQHSIFVYSLLLTVGFLLTLRLFMLVDKYAVNILFWDQWDFYNAFFQNRSLWEVFSWQHGPHRQGVGFVFTKFLAELSGWNSRTEAFAITGIICLSTILALYLRLRLFGPLFWGDVAIPLTFLTPAQYEIFIITPNLSHGAFPLLLLVLYCFGWTIQKRFLRYCVVLALNFLLIYTGFGIFIGVITPIIFIVDLFLACRNGIFWDMILSAFFTLLSFVSFGLFFIDYSIAPAADCFQFPHPQYWEYPQFMALTFANFMGLRGVGLKQLIMGGIVLLIMIFISIHHTKKFLKETYQSRKMNIVIVILLVFSLLFSANTALGRVCLGMSAAQASRYVTYLIPAFFGLFLHILTIQDVKIKNFFLAITIIILFVASFPLKKVDWETMKSFSHGKKQWKEHYLRTEDIEESNLTSGFKIYPWPEHTKLKEKLDYLKMKKLNLYRDHVAD